MKKSRETKNAHASQAFRVRTDFQLGTAGLTLPAGERVGESGFGSTDSLQPLTPPLSLREREPAEFAATNSPSLIDPSPPHGVVLAVRPHVDRGGDPIGHVEESRDRRNVPDVAIRESDAPQPLAV